MYDYLLGEEVKCFYDYYWNGSCIQRMDGIMNVYLEGDKVPYDMGYYDYKKNFMVLILSECPDFPVALIREGKAFSLKDFSEVTEKEISENDTFIDGSGNLLKISSLSSLVSFCKNYQKYQDNTADYFINRMPYQRRREEIYSLPCLSFAQKEERDRLLKEILPECTRENAEYLRYRTSLREELIEPFYRKETEEDRKKKGVCAYRYVLSCLREDGKTCDDKEKNQKDYGACYEAYQEYLKKEIFVSEKRNERKNIL